MIHAPLAGATSCCQPEAFPDWSALAALCSPEPGPGTGQYRQQVSINTTQLKEAMCCLATAAVGACFMQQGLMNLFQLHSGDILQAGHDPGSAGSIPPCQ
jgi:hypothetical protein